MAGHSSESAHLLTERAQREQRLFARDCVVALGASPALNKGSRDGSAACSRLRRRHEGREPELPLTLVAWAIELRDWWSRRREVQLAETWDDTTLVSACDEPTIVERPPWADESRVSAAATLGGRRR